MVLVLNVDNNETLLVLRLGPFALFLIKHTFERWFLSQALGQFAAFPPSDFHVQIC